MDKGKLFHHEFQILPTQEGGFIVVLGKNFAIGEMGEPRWAYELKRYAFSSVRDLMRWLDGHADGFAGEKQSADHMAAVRDSVQR